MLVHDTRDQANQYLNYVFVSGVVVAAICSVLPHLIGGKLRHGEAYRFYQPFVGGMKFVILQGCAIALVTVGLVASLTALTIGLDAVPMTGPCFNDGYGIVFFFRVFFSCFTLRVYCWLNFSCLT